MPRFSSAAMHVQAYELSGLYAGLLNGACLAIAISWLLFFKAKSLALWKACGIILAWGLAWLLGTWVMGNSWNPFTYLGMFGFLPGLATGLLLPGRRDESARWLRTTGRALLAGLGWAAILGLYYIVRSATFGASKNIWTWIDGPYEGTFTGIAGLLYTYWLVHHGNSLPGRQALFSQIKSLPWRALARQWLLPLLVVGLASEASYLYLRPTISMAQVRPSLYGMRSVFAGSLSGAGLTMAFAWILFFKGKKLNLLKAGIMILAWGAAWFAATSFMGLLLKYGYNTYFAWSPWIYIALFGFVPGLVTLLLLPGHADEPRSWLRLIGRALLAGLGWAAILGLFYLLSISVGHVARGAWAWLDRPLSGTITGIAGLLWMYWLVFRAAPRPGK